MARAEIRIIGMNANLPSGAGTNYVIKTLSHGLYQFSIEPTTTDVLYSKSTDGGLTWKDAVIVRTGSVLSLAVWYDRWSGIAGDLIHIAYVDDGVDDILYRNLDPATSDALSTETTVFLGATAVGAGALTIWRERNGDLRVAGSIDAGAEDGAWSSTDVGATWADVIADPSEAATQDQYFGLPGWNADTADGMLIFVDASANGLSVKRYDDSANTWAETAIIADGSFTDLLATSQFPNVACTVDLANSRNIVVAWTATDTLNADLRLFFITDTAVTESAVNVVLNSTDDQGMCAVGLDTDTGKIYVFYCGKSDGSETFATALNIYYKTTTDDGANWSAETLLTNEAHSISYLFCTPRFPTDFVVAFGNITNTPDFIQASVLIPAAGGSANLLAGKL